MQNQQRDTLNVYVADLRENRDMRTNEPLYGAAPNRRLNVYVGNLRKVASFRYTSVELLGRMLPIAVDELASAGRAYGSG